MDVLESEHLMTGRLAYTVAVAALHGNSDADIGKGSDLAYDMYQRALGALPYYAALAPADDAEAGAGNERDEAVRKWRELKARHDKEPQEIKG